MHTRAQPHTLVHTRAYSHIPMHTCAHPRTPTHTHMHTPHTYTLMPADALNLINHMKLHVNGKIWKKRDRWWWWKKKEQESAEAISGLKICFCIAYKCTFMILRKILKKTFFKMPLKICKGPPFFTFLTFFLKLDIMGQIFCSRGRPVEQFYWTSSRF